MESRQLGISGAWEFAPQVHTGSAGTFVEPYSAPEFAEAVGHPISLGHLNVSVATAGTLRGIHFGDVPPGQAKYITCVAGAVWDVVVDLRVGSPTFGKWEGVLLDDQSRRAVYLGEGLGHGYVSLEDRSVLVYACSQPYVAGREHRINSLDPAMSIDWPTTGRDGAKLDFIIGRQDRAAPTLKQALDRGMLPDLRAVNAWVASMREKSGKNPGSPP
ncbi:dTDP-4-dehydrorhamnose 3,5-epimerase family protein [Polyangium aurulentum]|uniref:dTDP-4-dehydrorhamnose 3,5-epimerase family protein n=1 Tax=Polyangium aurulentum TaxID=2567896 RepID=UPI0010AED87D|nr:dTDP-4-dehydrorhamnose 3,5-epimerase [Polyangium aurulentum]UQA61787.1 dTDP-4-dehydrorhamnose 3,5-epimerase [Polyangium aurulentum]